jgi:hypothetical protein
MEKILCWSDNNEDFNTPELCDLISNNEELVPGSVVYVGGAIKPTYDEIFSVPDIIERIQDGAYDIGGECAWDYLENVTEEAIKELKSLIESWLDKNSVINFYNVKNVKPYVLTEEDFE